jgi:hypothetical protein
VPMLVNESLTLGKYLFSVLQKSSNRSVLNIGSSTLEYRTHSQPYIQNKVFGPVEENLGATVIHCDAKAESGADVIIDLLSSEAVSTLAGFNAHVFVVSNLLEHVESVGAAVHQLEMIIPTGAYLVASGPKNFPYHPDPIDNMFRPGRRQVESLFGNFNLLEWGEAKHRTLATSVFESRRGAANWVLQEVASASPSKKISTLIRSLSPVSSWCALMQKR